MSPQWVKNNFPGGGVVAGWCGVVRRVCRDGGGDVLSGLLWGWIDHSVRGSSVGVVGPVVVYCGHPLWMDVGPRCPAAGKSAGDLSGDSGIGGRIRGRKRFPLGGCIAAGWMWVNLAAGPSGPGGSRGCPVSRVGAARVPLAGDRRRAGSRRGVFTLWRSEVADGDRRPERVAAGSAGCRTGARGCGLGSAALGAEGAGPASTEVDAVAVRPPSHGQAAGRARPPVPRAGAGWSAFDPRWRS